MGTRLYPCTKDPANLEKLCNVESGSYQRLRMLEEMTANFRTLQYEMFHEDCECWIKSEHDQEFDYELWRICDDNEDLSRLNGFLLSGWGKVERLWLPDNVKFEGSIGGTDDPDESVNLIHASDMGAYWRTLGKHPYDPETPGQVARLWHLCEGVSWH